MVYHFTFKHHWHVKMHMMSGITFRSWLTVLWKHFRDIDFHVYWHRVVFLTFMSVINTALSVFDWILYSRKIEKQPINPEPVFILGHPRTGTTHLHNLLSRDPYFAFANMFHVGFPSAFLSLEWARGLLSPLLDPRRPMDNMALHWDLPGEDEIAVNVLSGGVSPYMAIVLPRAEERAFRQYYTFSEAPPADLHCWLSAFRWFMKKVTLRWGGCKPLLIKSPCHTHRIRLWRELFPRAKFIYIHRHPLQVFQSAAHMADTYFWYTYLQRPEDAHVHRYIIDQYRLMYHEYLQYRSTIPADQLLELSFDDLEADPLACMRRIYDQFGWGERFGSVEGTFREYCKSLGDFKKNQFNRLSPEMEAEVREAWGPSFETFGYPQ